MPSLHRIARHILLLQLLVCSALPTTAVVGEESSKTAALQIASDRASFGFYGVPEELADSRWTWKVTALVPSGPAEAAGLRPDDLILAIENWQVDARNRLEMVLATNRFKAGNTYSFTVQRDKETFELSMIGETTSEKVLRRLSQAMAVARRGVEGGESPSCEENETASADGSEEPSPFWKQLLDRTRQSEGESILRVQRTAGEYVFTASSPELGLSPRTIELTDLLPGFARIAQKLERGASIGIRMRYSPDSRTYRITLVETMD